MRAERFYLKNTFPVLGEGDRNPCLDAYIPDNVPKLYPDRKHPAVLICPGGAYIDLAERECEPVALFFMSLGFASFVLRYSTAPTHYPVQLMEASASAAFIRSHAGSFQIDVGRFFVCGFSAGGHLDGSLGILGNDPAVLAPLGIERAQSRPDGMILCYPVVDSSIYSERINCFDFLMGKKSCQELREKASLSRHVTAETPPAFLWHTVPDASVPVQSSLVLAAALEEKGVPFELHIFCKGPHGLSLCNHQTASEETPQYVNPEDAQWKELLKNWLSAEYKIQM